MLLEEVGQWLMTLNAGFAAVEEALAQVVAIAPDKGPQHIRAPAIEFEQPCHILLIAIAVDIVPGGDQKACQ